MASDMRVAGMCLLMILVTCSLNLQAAQTAGVGQQIKLRHHAGVVFREEHSVGIVLDYWHHTYKITLPPSYVRLRNGTWTCQTTRNASACDAMNHAMRILLTAQNRVIDKLVEVKNEIYTLIPDRHRLGIRTKRSAGEWGLSNAMMTMGGLSRVESDMGSVIAIENRQIKTIQQVLTFEQQSMQRQFNRIETILRASVIETEALTIVASQITDVIAGMTAIDVLINSIRKAVFTRQLDPAIVKRETIAETLNNISAALHNSVLGLTPAPTINDFYSLECTVERRLDDVFVRVKIPLTSIDRPIKLFHMMKFGLALPSSQVHVSMLETDVTMVGYDEISDTFIESLEIIPTNRIYVDVAHTTVTVLEKQNSCVKSIFLGNMTGVHELCDYHILLDSMSPKVLRLNSSLVLLTAFQNYTLECNRSKVVHQSAGIQQLINIPCFCSLTAGRTTVPKNYRCLTAHDSVHFISHITNIPYLLEFTPGVALGGLQLSTLYQHEMAVTMPELKLLDDNITEGLAAIENSRLNMKAAAAKVSKHEILYRRTADLYAHQLEKLREIEKQADTTELESGIKSWFTTPFMSVWDTIFHNSISASITTIVAFIALALSMLNLCRSCQAGLLAGLPRAVMAARIAVRSTPRPIPRLINLMPTTSTAIPSTADVETKVTSDVRNVTWSDASSLPKSEINHILDGVTIGLVGFLILAVLIGFAWWKRKRAQNKRVALFLQIANQNVEMNVFWKALNAGEYQAYSIFPVPMLQVEGRVFKTLHIHWPDLQVQNADSTKFEILEFRIPINWLAARKIQTIFGAQFWTRIVIKTNGRIIPLTVQARDALNVQSANEPTAPVAENKMYPTLTHSVGSQTDLFMPMPIRK